MNSEIIREIKKIISDLENHINVNKADILAAHIKNRLNKSLNMYYLELNKSLDKLSVCDDKYTLRLVRKLNKGD